ncbi:MAG: sensor histidine kinase KdpD, partial [bacterium]|nr:sensor histidine kinase KdpD [Candidatus Kapabacteria bacterium]
MPPRNDEVRPSPDALLANVTREERAQAAHLKVFLGMAPGVGKTYTMLESARVHAMAGKNVVVGIVETHGRTETAELLLGLDIIPRRKVEYKGSVLDEMDVDAIVARSPSLVLVDELAHTNVPGSHHAKRYRDVEDLLAAGIDVYTTLNIQHLESLNDAVAQITNVRVRETVPDRMLERADEVELVDLPVDELLERLRLGKVYLPAQAERAVRSYFREGNLSALRQLALRYVAERVDKQMHSYMQAHAISGPWPTHERLMVSVGPSPTSARLVRATRRMAARRGAEWIAAYVETPRHHRMTDIDRARVARTLGLAEELGGTSATIAGEDVSAELLRFARKQNVTEIVVGKSMRKWWIELVRGSIVADLVQNRSNIDVYVVTGDDDADTPKAGEQLSTTIDDDHRKLGAFAWATLTVAIAGALCAALDEWLSLPNLSMVFLVGVLFIAVRWGLRPSIYTSVLSLLVYDFFFVPPHFTFTISSPQDVLALVVFLIVGILTSNLTGRIRDQAISVRAREARTAALYDLSRRVAGELDLDVISNTVVDGVSRHLDADVALFVVDNGRLISRACAPDDHAMSEAEHAAATWTYEHNRMAGNGTDTLPGEQWLYIPMRSAGHVVGVLALHSHTDASMVDPDQRRLIEAFADLGAVAVDRARQSREIERVKLVSERERLQGLLLSSISHDLRTPLASIIGAATSLLDGGARYSEDVRSDLASTIREEGERLNRFVGNLLDTTRLEAGPLTLNRE